MGSTPKWDSADPYGPSYLSHSIPLLFSNPGDVPAGSHQLREESHSYWILTNPPSAPRRLLRSFYLHTHSLGLCLLVVWLTYPISSIHNLTNCPFV